MKPIQLGGIAVKCNPLVVFVIPTAAVFGLLDVLLLSVISLGIHEFAHLIFAKRLGVRVIELEILPIGCVARIDPDSLAISRDELFIALVIKDNCKGRTFARLRIYFYFSTMLLNQ